MTASRILWATIGGFLVGVFLRSFIPLGLAFAGFLVLLGTALMCAGFFDRAKLRTLTIVAVVLVACAAGVLRMHVATLSGDPTLTSRLNKTVVLEGVVADEPDVRDTGVRILLAATTLVAASSASTTLSTNTIPVHAGVLVLAAPHTRAAYGDRVRVSGTLRLPQAFDTAAGRQFNYPAYLAKDGIGYELAFAKVESIGANEGNPLKALALRAKERYLTGLRATLPEPEAGLASGITVGDRRGPGVELSNTFRNVSLIHIVVLSGYNIMIVVNAVRFLIGWLPRLFQYGGLTVAVLFFVLMTGSAASAVRAGAMALLAVFARATGRVYIAARALGAVAFAMVLYNPFTLAFDPSFQLSAIATVGIIFFTPLFFAHLSWIPERFGMREIASSTLGTQLAVVPLLLYENGQLSLVGLPANLLTLIAVPWAMLTSFIAALGGMTFGSLAVLLAAPAYLLLAYIIGVARFLAALPFAVVPISTFGAWWVFAAYALMFGGWWLIKRKSTGARVGPSRDSTPS